MDTVETQEVKTPETENKVENKVETPATENNGGNGAETKTSEPYKTFTSKEDFDRHSAGILNSAKNKAEKELLAMLGLKPDEKDKLAKFKEAYDATLSESEKQAKNLENLKAGTLGDPSETITLLRYWQNQERAHYPHARENVEYFRSLLEENPHTDTTNESEDEAWQKNQM